MTVRSESVDVDALQVFYRSAGGIRLLDIGHFAPETSAGGIAEAIRGFLRP